ncbi:MAG: hypothetical protein P8Y66_08755 [Nitrospirota bacterium]
MSKRGILLLLGITCSLILAGCVSVIEGHSPAGATYLLPPGQCEDIQPADFPARLKDLEEDIGKAKTETRLARLHLRRAGLLLHRANPSPDYEQALKELQAYLSLEPEGDTSCEVRNLAALLSLFLDARKAQVKAEARAEQLHKDVEGLTREKARLEKELAEVRESLRKLQRLDLQMEEKRRQIQ